MPNPLPSLSITVTLQLHCRHRRRYTPNPTSLLSIIVPLNLPCCLCRRYTPNILLFFFPTPLSLKFTKKAMAMVTKVAGNAIINRVVQLMTDVIKEDHRHILQTDLRGMDNILQYIVTLFGDEREAPPEMVKIWLQLLHNSLAEAKRLIDLSARRPCCCLDSVVGNPRRPSKQIREWQAFFNHVYQGFVSDLFQDVGLSRNVINREIGLVIELLNGVIDRADNRRILQADLRSMEILLQDITILFRNEVDISRLFPHQQKSPLLTWLQLLEVSLAEGKELLDRSGPRGSCLDCLVLNLGGFSKEIKEWKAFFYELHHGCRSDLSVLVTSLQSVSLKPFHKGEAVFGDKATSAFLGSGIMDAQAQLERWLGEGDRVRVIGVYGMPGVGKTSLLQMVRHKLRGVWKVIWVKIRENFDLFDWQRAIGDQISLRLSSNFHFNKRVLSANLEEMKFLLVLDDLTKRVDLQQIGVAFGAGKHSKVLFSTRRNEVIREMGAEESIEMQPLSRDEGWMLFRRVAFKDDQISMDIQERAKRFADQCKGVPLAINIVAAVIGQTSVDEWDTCLSLMKNVDPSYPDTHSGLDPQLCTLFRWSYDALPNSKVKNCFLYCAMYEEDQEIVSRQLVEMWIGEGLVKSKQGTHLMDTAIGHKYLKLLVDRYLFQIVSDRKDVFWNHCIRVPGVIRRLARHIAQKEENWLFMGSQNRESNAELHDENCRRISVPCNYTTSLPTDLRCPKLASLFFKDNAALLRFPSEFLLCLASSVRVLNLSGCIYITSVPTSVGQLRLLEFLSLSRLSITDLPEEICHFPALQFLDLSGCTGLKSLPSQIGDLKTLKNLNLDGCSFLQMIPREISKLASLTRLQLAKGLSVEMESPASIWSLKGLQNLTELQVRIDDKSSTIKDGIVGTWPEMRHLQLAFEGKFDFVMGDLPQDMQKIKKLQSLKLYNYGGSSLPNYKFEHLEMVQLEVCCNITQLSPLERLPNLKFLRLLSLPNLRELRMGSPSGYPRLHKLVLWKLERLESLGGPLNTGVWDERTLPRLGVLKIRDCPSLKRFPIGMDKLRNLCALIYSSDIGPSSKKSALKWWENIIWEDDNLKAKFQKIFIARDV